MTHSSSIDNKGAEEPLNASRLRTIAGHFPSGVVVVAAASAAGPVGFTCQSFTSLSLEPPLVSFNPATTSTSWPKIREIGRFCINVLAASQQDVSTAFARSGADRFAGMGWSPSPSGAPVIDGVVSWIDCCLECEYPGGDHTIVVARVTGLGPGSTAAPLLFHRGAYAAVA